MKRTIEINGIDGTQYVDVKLTPLARDLSADGFLFLDLDELGALRVLTGDTIEVWQAMPEGFGCNNIHWGDHPGGFEFCHSYSAGGIKTRGEYMKGIE